MWATRVAGRRRRPSGRPARSAPTTQRRRSQRPAQRLARARRRARPAAPGSSPTLADARDRHGEDRAHRRAHGLGAEGVGAAGPERDQAAPKASALRSTVPTLPGSRDAPQRDAERPGRARPSAARRRRARACPSRGPRRRRAASASTSTPGAQLVDRRPARPAAAAASRSSPSATKRPLAAALEPADLLELVVVGAGDHGRALTKKGADPEGAAPGRLVSVGC